MSLTSIRGKDWVFNALWAACGAYHQSIGSTSTEIMSNCSLDIPFTCLFQEGTPTKALMTDSVTGKLKRVQIDRMDASGTHVPKGMKGAVLRPLQGLRKCLIDYSLMSGYDRAQQGVGEIMVATIIYADDEIEHLPLHTLDLLMRNETWRLQVLIVQGFVPTLSMQTGMYSKEPQVL